MVTKPMSAFKNLKTLKTRAGGGEKMLIEIPRYFLSPLSALHELCFRIKKKNMYII